MRKTSHDGVDTTSLTSGIENELKKNSTTGIMKMKKSSIKRKVPNFSHESDDGIVEPLLQSDKDKSEAAPRSAKYLLSKTKTDSISENEDSIKMSEINITCFSASTPTTAADKVGTSTNTMNNVKDTNNVSTGANTLHNHMNTNVFCVPEASKCMISTKSPLLVELDAPKTTGYSPSLIFTTAKIHSDCKTKLMEPVQISSVPVTSTTENDVEASDSGNNIIEKLNISTKDDKLNLESDIRNNSTSKAILNFTQKSTNLKSEEYIPKNAVGNNISIKTSTKNTTANISNAKTVSHDLNNKNTEQMQSLSKQIGSQGETIEKLVSDNGDLSSIFIKSAAEQTNKEKGDKKLIVQGSKKLQRQKKATIDEPHDSTSSANITKDKTSPDDKSAILQTRTITDTSTIPSTVAAAKSQSAENYILKSNNIAKNTTSTSQSIESSKISSQIGSIAKLTDSKVQTPVSKNVTQQQIVSNKITSPVVSLPKATDDKIHLEVTKNLTSQPIKSSKMPSQDVKVPKSTDSKIQTQVSKIPTPTSLVSNIIQKSTSQTTASKTIHNTGSIKIDNSNKKEGNLNTINKNESSIVTKSSAKEISPVATEKSSSVPKTLPSNVVSTSKSKIGAPVVTSVTLKSEVSKSSNDSKSTTSSYLVKTTPATKLKTLTSSESTPVASGSALKSEPKKLATNSKSSVNSHLVKTTPATSLKTATTLSTPVVTSATLKSEPSKSTSDFKNTKSLYSVRTTPAASLTTSSTTTTVPTPATTSATLKSELNKSVSDSKSSTNSYLVKTTPATSVKTSTTTALSPTSSSSQGTKQSGPVKQTKTNTEKQKDGGKA